MRLGKSRPKPGRFGRSPRRTGKISLACPPDLGFAAAGSADRLYRMQRRGCKVRQRSRPKQTSGCSVREIAAKARSRGGRSCRRFRLYRRRLRTMCCNNRSLSRPDNYTPDERTFSFRQPWEPPAEPEHFAGQSSAIYGRSSHGRGRSPAGLFGRARSESHSNRSLPEWPPRPACPRTQEPIRRPPCTWR